MILPLGDAPNPRGVPVITYALIAANVAVYVLISLPLGLQAPDPRDPLLLEYLQAIAQARPGPIPAELVRQISEYDLFLFQHGFRPVDPSLADLAFSMFLHGGFMHLFGNMLFLWIYGDNVEHRLGRLPYLAAYLATGVAATLFFSAFEPDSPLPMVGASGAISGVLGFYFMWFPRNHVRLLVMLFPFLVDVIVVPARLLLGFYLLADNLLPFLLLRGASTGVAYGAHIGGFIAGMALAWWRSKAEDRRTPREYRAAPEPAPRQRIREALAEGRLEDAAGHYFALPAPETRRLLASGELLELAEGLAARGHPEAALTLYRRHLRDFPSGPGAARAHLGAADLLLGERGQAATAYQHYLDALDTGPDPEVAAAAREGLRRIEDLQKLPLRGLRRR